MAASRPPIEDDGVERAIQSANSCRSAPDPFTTAAESYNRQREEMSEARRGLTAARLEMEELRKEMKKARAELREEATAVRGDIQELRSELGEASRDAVRDAVRDVTSARRKAEEGVEAKQDEVEAELGKHRAVLCQEAEAHRRAIKGDADALRDVLKGGAGKHRASLSNEESDYCATLGKHAAEAPNALHVDFKGYSDTLEDDAHKHRQDTNRAIRAELKTARVDLSDAAIGLASALRDSDKLVHLTATEEWKGFLQSHRDTLKEDLRDHRKVLDSVASELHKSLNGAAPAMGAGTLHKLRDDLIKIVNGLECDVSTEIASLRKEFREQFGTLEVFSDGSGSPAPLTPRNRNARRTAVRGAWAALRAESEWSLKRSRQIIVKMHNDTKGKL